MPRLKATFLALISLLIVALLPPVLHAAERKIPSASNAVSASELANQLASAYGGMLRVKEMLNRGSRSHGFLKMVSTISDAANDFECVFVSKGDKIRVEMEFLGQPKIEVFNGKTGWIQTGDWVARTDSKTVERIADEMKHGLSALEKLDDLTYKLELLSPRQVKGKNCDVLKLTPPDGKWTVLYIDPISRLVLRSEFMGLDSEQGVPALKTTDYSDYRNVMGFPTPYKMEEFIAGKKAQETVFDSVSIDDGISDRVFEMPEESHYSLLDRGPITIPFEYSGNYIVIPARINHGPEVKFILDTGASQTVIDKTTAQALGPLTTRTFSVTALAKSVPLGYTKLNKIQIGDLDLDGIPVLVTDLSALSASAGQRPAGLIGASILERFRVTIDFQDKKIILADPRNARSPEGAIVIPTSPVFASTALVVSGILDGKPMNFLVDTGAPFNHLPMSLATAFNAGAPLPVGKITGLDGLSTNVGSIKLNNLKLGTYSIANPVFTVQPDKPGGAKGLSSANGMGILGNPTWSKTRLSIDYRNDRLIIEAPPETLKLDAILQEINECDRSYLRSKNRDAAATAYEKIMTRAHAEGEKAAEALALARLSSLYADKFSETKESRWLDMAAGEYEKAAKLAAESKNRSVEGQILAQWAMFYLNAPRSNTDLESARNLLKRALTRAPMEAGIYAALGSAMLKTGKSDGVKFINHALMLDPSNWQALWEKYKVFESDHKSADIKLVLAQMSRYYPDFPQVKELVAKFSKENAKAAAGRGGKPGQGNMARRSGGGQAKKSLPSAAR